jgi:hypothetical protein
VKTSIPKRKLVLLKMFPLKFNLSLNLNVIKQIKNPTKKKIIELGKLADVEENRKQKRLLNEAISVSADKIFWIDLKDEIIRMRIKVYIANFQKSINCDFFVLLINSHTQKKRISICTW